MPHELPAERRALKPDAQAFDEVRIITVPRYKTSGLSGDEWRISATIQFYRKGSMVHESGSFRDVETALAFLPSEFHRVIDNGKALFCGDGDLCDQEGCSDTATVVYRMKQQFCREGHASDPYEFDKRPLVRKFCERHSRRGDCGLDDADRNYELLSGGVVGPRACDIKPAGRVVACSIPEGTYRIGDEIVGTPIPVVDSNKE